MSGLPSVQETIKQLRAAMGGISQEKLAHEMNLTLRTIARYENEQPPTGKALIRFCRFASERGFKDLAMVFKASACIELMSDFGYPLSKLLQPLAAPDSIPDLGGPIDELLEIVWDDCEKFASQDLSRQEAIEVGLRIRQQIGQLRILWLAVSSLLWEAQQ